MHTREIIQTNRDFKVGIDETVEIYQCNENIAK
jgi:hypothetical protein